MTLYIAHSTGNWFIRDGMWGAATMVRVRVRVRLGYTCNGNMFGVATPSKPP